MKPGAIQPAGSELARRYQPQRRVTDTINMDNWSRDYAYGYSKSLAVGNYTSKAMDDGTARVRLLHFGFAGSYDSHTYVGSDIKI